MHEEEERNFMYFYLMFEDYAMHKERGIERTITSENDLALYKNIQHKIGKDFSFLILALIFFSFLNVRFTLCFFLNERKVFPFLLRVLLQHLGYPDGKAWGYCICKSDTITPDIPCIHLYLYLFLFYNVCVCIVFVFSVFFLMC